MYRIIGGDGRQSGPVDANEIRNWIFVSWPLTMLPLMFLYDDLFGSSQPKAV